MTFVTPPIAIWTSYILTTFWTNSLWHIIFSGSSWPWEFILPVHFPVLYGDDSEEGYYHIPAILLSGENYRENTNG
jgi:hypothetical protein